MPVTPVSDILTDPELRELRRQYDQQSAGVVFGAVLPMLYPPVTDYIEAVGSTLYPEWGQGQPACPIKPADRERCLLTLLGSRQETLNLAVHIYLALVNEISPGEIAHILVLAGIYSGMSSFAHSIVIEAATLGVLKGLLTTPNNAGPQAVYDALKATFRL